MIMSQKLLIGYVLFHMTGILAYVGIIIRIFDQYSQAFTINIEDSIRGRFDSV